ncbi:MAG TPA: hydrogenase maturation nickel metallochaperone HypA [Dehalococcoidia bacterium]|nr:hydrogenase maturation nickel metallochaperone HypA [Dehalococcoidia bacterium]
MHELAITEAVIGLVREHAEKAGARKVGRINLVVGELTGFVGDCVQFYFDHMTKGTIMENAELTFKTIATTGRCRDCGKEFEIVEMDWTCPSCKGNSIQLVGGNELFVESIEVEEHGNKGS